MRKQVKQLNAKVIQNREAVLANERLQQLLKLRDAMHVPTIAARVIGEDVTPWFRTVIIDRGSVDGVREGMPVVASGGVVGRIVRVASTSSRLLLLTDNASAIAATVQRSRARGVVKGKSGQLCSLEFSQRGEDVKVGDVIVTSGIGGVFPECTSVGRGYHGKKRRIRDLSNRGIEAFRFHVTSRRSSGSSSIAGDFDASWSARP